RRRHAAQVRFRASMIGEAPPWSAKPTALVRNVLVPVKPCDLLPAATGKGFGECAFGYLVAAAGAGEYLNWRNPLCQIVRSSSLNSEHRAGIRQALRRNAAKSLIRRHRHDQTAAIGKAIEPECRWPRAAGIDIDDIGDIRMASACRRLRSLRHSHRAPGWLGPVRRGSHHIRSPLPALTV